jgi:hypothetical protein
VGLAAVMPFSSRQQLYGKQRKLPPYARRRIQAAMDLLPRHLVRHEPLDSSWSKTTRIQVHSLGHGVRKDESFHPVPIISGKVVARYRHPRARWPKAGQAGRCARSLTSSMSTTGRTS